MNLYRIFKTADKFFGQLSNICAIISGVLLVFMALTIAAGVINRTFIGMIWLFVEEWSALALVPATYFALGYTLRQNRHLRMDLLVNKLSIKWQNILAIFVGTIALVCLFYMIQFAFDRFFYSFTRSVISPGPMRTPLYPFAAAMLIGICLFTIDMFCFLIGRILELRKGEHDDGN